MNKRAKYISWLLLLLLAAAVFAVIFIPVWLIQPFAPQTERDLAISFALRNWSPIITVAGLILSLILAFIIWRNSAHWWGKTFIVLPLALIVLCTWFARQNHFEWMFNPLKNSAYVKIPEADFVKDSDVVMAVKINGEAVAYPVRLIAYHHIVQDVVGGQPITATY